MQRGASRAPDRTNENGGYYEGETFVKGGKSYIDLHNKFDEETNRVIFLFPNEIDMNFGSPISWLKLLWAFRLCNTLQKTDSKIHS